MGSDDPRLSLSAPRSIVSVAHGHVPVVLLRSLPGVRGSPPVPGIAVIHFAVHFAPERTAAFLSAARKTSAPDAVIMLCSGEGGHERGVGAASRSSLRPFLHSPSPEPPPEPRGRPTEPLSASRDPPLTAVTPLALLRHRSASSLSSGERHFRRSSLHFRLDPRGASGSFPNSAPCRPGGRATVGTRVRIPAP